MAAGAPLTGPQAPARPDPPKAEVPPAPGPGDLTVAHRPIDKPEDIRPSITPPSGTGTGSSQTPHGQASLVAYAFAVCASGLLLLVLLATSPMVRKAAGEPIFWVLSAFVVVAELFPITIQRRGEQVDEITTSTTFAFALVLACGTGPAAIALAVASLVGDLTHRKAMWRSLFNVAQYTLSIGAAGWVYSQYSPHGAMTASHLPAALLAAVVFFVVNTLLTSIGISLALRISFLGYLARDITIQASTAPALLALAPLVVLAAQESLWFVPLFAVPIAAVYWGARVGLENVRLVERLQDSLEQMTEVNRAKDDFVAVVSHELRTPLTSIQGYLKTLLQLSGELEQEQSRAFLQAADRQGDRLRQMIEQLLVVARLESHVEPLSLSSISIHQLAANVVDELRGRAVGHRFEIRIDPDIPPVETDEGKVHQILSNLVENALKYSPAGTRVTIRGQGWASGVILSVQDHGHGIPTEAQPHVFDRFYQVDSSITRKVGGTGLGLYICRKMADTIGAKVWLDHSDRSGSRFCLSIPPAPPTDPSEVEEEPVTERGWSRRQSITASV